MYVYIDESGNSGVNISDSAQPFFYALSLQSKVDFEKRIKCQMAKIRNDIQCSELHGNEIGIAKIDSIADSLLSICKKYEFSFHLSIIEKKFLAIVQLFECLFDSGINRGVPYHIYNIFEFRGVLLVKVASIIDDDIICKFWNGCIHENNTEKAHTNLQNICDIIIDNTSRLKDARSKELIKDALTWAKVNCSEFLPLFDEKYLNLTGSANFIAFTMQLPAICKTSAAHKQDMNLIIHDEQSQFKKTFEYYYDIMCKAEKITLPSYFCPETTLDFEPIRNCIFTMEPSDKHDGLQLVDIFLYLIKKHYEGKRITGKAKKLLSHIIQNTSLHDLMYNSFVELLKYRISSLNNLKSSPEDLKKVKELFDNFNNQKDLAMKELKEKQVVDDNISKGTD